MNKKTIMIYILSILTAICIVTAVAAAVKPSINKTVILQIQKYIKK